MPKNRLTIADSEALANMADINENSAALISIINAHNASGADAINENNANKDSVDVIEGADKLKRVPFKEGDTIIETYPLRKRCDSKNVWGKRCANYVIMKH